MTTPNINAANATPVNPTMLDRLKGGIAQLKEYYPPDHCIKNIAIGILVGTGRIAATSLLFPSAVTAAPMSEAVVTLYVIKSCIFAPILEECLFRGMMMGTGLDEAEKANEETIGKIKVITRSAVLFGAMHVFVPQKTLEMRAFSALSSTIGGLIYGIERAYTGNLWASTITHSMFNARLLFGL